MAKRKNNFITEIKKVSKTVNKKVAKVQVTILLSLIFFLIVTPISTLQKLFKKQPQSLKTNWQKIENPALKLEDFYKQY